MSPIPSGTRNRAPITNARKLGSRRALTRWSIFGVDTYPPLPSRAHLMTSATVSCNDTSWIVTPASRIAISRGMETVTSAPVPGAASSKRAGAHLRRLASRLRQSNATPRREVAADELAQLLDLRRELVRQRPP